MIENQDQEEVAVYLSPARAELFKMFCEYQDMFELLVDNGVFEAGKSVVTITLSQPRIITDIFVNQNRYKRRKVDKLV